MSVQYYKLNNSLEQVKSGFLTYCIRQHWRNAGQIRILDHKGAMQE